MGAVAALRGDRRFFADFSTRLDALHEQYQVCPRGADGYLGDTAEMPGDELVRRNVAIMRTIEEEEYVDRAAESLRAAGFDAWRNEVGHVAFTPTSK